MTFTYGNKKYINFRQLEAVVRIAESLAKMKLHAVAGEDEVDEALRLFQVSTLDAALSGNLSGMCSCVLSAQKKLNLWRHIAINILLPYLAHRNTSCSWHLQ